MYRLHDDAHSLSLALDLIQFGHCATKFGSGRVADGGHAMGMIRQTDRCQPGSSLELSKDSADCNFFHVIFLTCVSVKNGGLRLKNLKQQRQRIHLTSKKSNAQATKILTQTSNIIDFVTDPIDTFLHIHQKLPDNMIGD